MGATGRTSAALLGDRRLPRTGRVSPSAQHAGRVHISRPNKVLGPQRAGLGWELDGERVQVDLNWFQGTQSHRSGASVAGLPPASCPGDAAERSTWAVRPSPSPGVHPLEGSVLGVLLICEHILFAKGLSFWEWDTMVEGKVSNLVNFFKKKI